MDPTDGTLVFATNKDQIIACQVQLPHDWRAGSSLWPHVHYMKTTSAAGTVKWDYRHRIANRGDVFSAWSAWINMDTVEHSDGDTEDQHAMVGAPALTMVGKTASCIILVNVRRNSAGGADSYGAAAKLLEFDLHYQRNGPGTAL